VYVPAAKASVASEPKVIVMELPSWGGQKATVARLGASERIVPMSAATRS
jgi:hypothetical protein